MKWMDHLSFLSLSLSSLCSIILSWMGTLIFHSANNDRALNDSVVVGVCSKGTCDDEMNSPLFPLVKMWGYHRPKSGGEADGGGEGVMGETCQHHIGIERVVWLTKTTSNYETCPTLQRVVVGVWWSTFFFDKRWPLLKLPPLCMFYFQHETPLWFTSGCPRFDVSHRVQWQRHVLFFV